MPSGTPVAPNEVWVGILPGDEGIAYYIDTEEGRESQRPTLTLHDLGMLLGEFDAEEDTLP